MNQRLIRAFLNGEKKGAGWLLLTGLLVPLSLLYGIVMKVRRQLYSSGILRSNRLAAPVISVGNITAGGTGKTPVVAWIARWYIDRGKRVAVLSRGYGGKGDGSPAVVSDGATTYLTAEEAGDEPVLLARSVPGLVVVTGHDRYQAGLLAQERFSPDIIILDDGFQHLRLRRDLDILLLDARRPFGNGFVFPAGLLREWRSTVSAADAVIVTRGKPDDNFPILPIPPVAWCSHRIAEAVVLADSSTIATGDIPHPVVAFAGIADPESFFSCLEDEGLTVAAKLAFPDHAQYNTGLIGRIAGTRDAVSAAAVVTTEKDAVKLDRHAEKLGRVYAARLALGFVDDGPLQDILRKVVPDITLK